MDLKGKISYCLIGLGFVSMLFCLVCAGGWSSSISVYLFLLSITFWSVGIPLYYEGYEKVILVKDIKCTEEVDDIVGTVYTDYRLYDEEGEEFKCAMLLRDVFEVGKSYKVRVSYNNEIFRLVEE